MAAVGSVTISGLVSGLSEGSVTIGPITISMNSAVYQDNAVNLLTNDNTIAVPTGATVCLILFPAGNTQAIKFKGAAGDTGNLLNKTGVVLLELDSTVTSFILNAAGAVNGVRVIFA